jgi:hypothetical protein
LVRDVENDYLNLDGLEEDPMLQIHVLTNPFSREGIKSYWAVGTGIRYRFGLDMLSADQK